MPMKTSFALLSLSLLAVSCAHQGFEAHRGPADVGSSVPFAPGNGPNGGSGNHAAGSLPSAVPAGEAKAQCGLNLYSMPVSSQGMNVGMLVYGPDYAYNSGLEGVLGQFLGNSAPGSDVFEAARNSPAWYYSTQYVNGAVADQFDRLKGNTLYPGYYSVQRMARLVVAAMQVAGDRECVRMVENVARVRLNSVFFAEFEKILPMILDARDPRSPKTVQQRFEEVDHNRTQLKTDIASLETAISAKEKSNERSLKLLNDQLKDAYRDLRLDLSKVPVCQNTVSFKLLTLTDDVDAKTHAQDIVDACVEKISKALDRATDEQTRLIARLDRLKKGRAEDSEPTAQEEALNKDLEGVQSRAEKYQNYKDMLLNPETSSIASHLEDINTYFDQKKKLTDPNEAIPERVTRNQKADQLKSLSPQWISYGSMGGFATQPAQPVK